MNAIVKKTLLVGLTTLTLMGCTSSNFVKDIFQTAELGYVAQLPRGDDELINFPIVDRGHYNDKEEVVYYVKFVEVQKPEYFTLSSEFAGKKISLVERSDEHTLRISVTGKSTTSSTGVVFGTLTIDPKAYEVVDESLKGATISLTLALGDKAGQAERFL